MKRLDIITSEGYIEATLEQCEYDGLNKEQTASRVKKIIDEAIRLVSKNESLHFVSCFSSNKVKQAYEDGQYDSEEGKGNKFDINNYS